ncbi:Chromatin modification-related protein EAF1 A [Camellia lanceoleosa]|uniref:Chromatin modification-related protein EAF1 A n=1 Tax=Camellia lanceoleosa TaxID=1840588 RepID=A0ACC0IQI7_9ERIC|nr:Chromatin modification-related protein EAF1 A [Camellia lanceoleosa]
MQLPSTPPTPPPLQQQQQSLQQQMPPQQQSQQSGLSVSGVPPGTDHGVRMLPGGNGVGIMCGMNRSMPMARPGFQGIAPPSMVNSGSMLSSSVAMMPSPVNMHSGVGSGQGNSMLRPRDTLNVMRPGQNSEHQRKMMVPDLQMQQVPQGNNNQGVPLFDTTEFKPEVSVKAASTHYLFFFLLLMYLDSSRNWC